jgi:hypothetical protein
LAHSIQPEKRPDHFGQTNLNSGWAFLLRTMNGRQLVLSGDLLFQKTGKSVPRGNDPNITQTIMPDSKTSYKLFSFFTFENWNLSPIPSAHPQSQAANPQIIELIIINIKL